MMLDEELLEKNGWTVECESPFEIRHEDGSFASMLAADMVLYELTRDEKYEKLDLPELEKRVSALEALVGSGIGGNSTNSKESQVATSEHKKSNTAVREYSQGCCHDGAAILCDGEPITIEQILERLRDLEVVKKRFS